MAVSEGRSWFHHPAGATSSRNMGWEGPWGRAGEGAWVEPLTGVEAPHAVQGVKPGITSLGLLLSAGFIYTFVRKEEDPGVDGRWDWDLFITERF